jgi:flagella basal body P-ring formation protein FlgA
MTRIRLTALVFTLIAGGSAVAAEGPKLKARIDVSSEIVRIGDLVADAGTFSSIAVFRAPDPGHTGAVNTMRVLEALRRHGLTDVNTDGLAEITVSRRGRSVSIAEIEEAVAKTLAGQRGLGAAKNLSISFDRAVRPLQIDVSAGELQASYGNYDPFTHRFDVSFTIGNDSSFRRGHLRFTGTVVETMEIATLTRGLGRGDLVRSSDIVMERKPKAQVPAGALSSVDQMVGLAARKPLQPSQPIRAADLMKPELVRANEAVTVTYEAPGITLSVRGKALEAGARGDVVNVLNIQSKRTMQGIVTGPGRISIAVPGLQTGTQMQEPTRSIASVTPQQRSE